MKVLLLHNYYQQPGGEDTVVMNEQRLLMQHGHDVQIVTFDNKNIVSSLDKFSAFLQSTFNFSVYRYIYNKIREQKINLVHIHNYHPLISLSAHVAASHAGAAVVQTLHNFRTICAASTLSRGNHICEKCIQDSKAWALYHKCYKNSLPGTISTLAMQYLGGQFGLFEKHVDAFIALTEFNKAKFVEAGFPKNRIYVKPNFAEDPGYVSKPRSQEFLFVGRLSKEKGVNHLISAWKHLPNMVLKIVGDGPERDIIKEANLTNVVFLGHCDQEAVRYHMSSCRALLVPSTWYEGFPMTIVEAFASGLPVLGSNIGSIAEIVKEGYNGLVFEPGDPYAIVDAVNRFQSFSLSATEFSANARKTYVDCYTEDRNAAMISRVYEDAINNRKKQSK